LATESDHIVKSFDQELEQIRATVVRMGSLAESQLASAVEALVKRDPELADRVVKADSQIDDLETALNSDAVKLLALRQPMANDLRAAVAALKIANDLERIGDYAANVAKRARTLAELEPVEELGQIRELAQLVQEQIKSIMEALIDGDEVKAKQVWQRDQTVDEHYGGLFRSVLDGMISNRRDIEACTHLLFIVKNIERIGDHATNIAELVYFQKTGSGIEGARPKGTVSDVAPVHPS